MRELYTGLKVETPAIRVVDAGETIDGDAAKGLLSKLQEILNQLESSDSREHFIKELIKQNE